MAILTMGGPQQPSAGTPAPTTPAATPAQPAAQPTTTQAAPNTTPASGSSQPSVTTPRYRTQAELKTSTLFNKELAVTNIAQQVSGMRWSVDYFNQIVGVNGQTKMPDINIPETSLSYNRIDKLDVYVDSGLPNSTVTDITGTGTINAGFVPFYGDAFITTVAGGRIAIFVITAVSKEYYNTHDIYRIEYKLTYFVDVNAGMYNDLIYKTVNSYVFDRTAIGTKGAPIILATDYVKKLDLNRVRVDMVNRYLDTFADTETKLLRLPTTASVYVDQLLNNFLLSMLSVEEFPKLLDLDRVDNGITSTSLWDALLNRDMGMFETCTVDMKYGMRNSRRSASVKLSSYLSMEYLITDTPVMVTATPQIKPNPLVTRKTVKSQVTPPNDAYVFSKDFYNMVNGVVWTDLETLVLQYIRGETLNRGLIDGIVADYKYWPYDEQYVLVPIVILLLTNLVNNTYSMA